MRKILLSIKSKPFNLILMILIPLLYLANNFYFKKVATGVFSIFFVGYFNDLICPLFLLSYSNFLLLVVDKELKKLHWILLFMLVCGCIWEFVTPLFKPSSVTDILDLVCYICGAFLYWLILFLYNKTRKKDRTTDNDTAVEK